MIAISDSLLNNHYSCTHKNHKKPCPSTLRQESDRGTERTKHIPIRKVGRVAEQLEEDGP